MSQKKIKIAALVTARGNNTYKNKHLVMVLNHPLVWYPIKAAKQCSQIERFYISSDDTEILNIAKEEDYRLIRRPDEISLSTSAHIDAIRHALNFMKDVDNYEPDILIVILGNTVYIKDQWILDSIKILSENEVLSAVVPVYAQNDHHPYRAKYLDKDGLLQPYFDFQKGISTNRQDLPNNYFLCHNFWTLRVCNSMDSMENGQAPWTFMGNKIYPIVLDGGPDVHSKQDIDLCERWLIDNADK